MVLSMYVCLRVYVFTLPLFEEESPYFVISMIEIPSKGRLKNARFILAHSLIGISVHHGGGWTQQ